MSQCPFQSLPFHTYGVVMNTQTQPKFNGELLFFLFLFFAAIIIGIGYGLVSAAEILALWISSHTRVSASTDALGVSFGSIVVVVALLIYAVFAAFRKSAQMRRQREFLDANPELSGDAIRKTVKHLKRNTAHKNVRFGTVGIALQREFYSNVHPALPGDVFAFDALRVYLHILDKKTYPLPRSIRPRK